MNLNIKIAFIVSLSLSLAAPAFSQKKVKLKQAGALVGGVDKEGRSFKRFVDNVIFEQSETTIYCDSAILYDKTNMVKAYGHVRITEGDSVTITSRRLTYDGNEKRAQLRENVVFKKLNRVTLYTDNLDYDRIKQEAIYFDGGKLVDSTNVLTSARGYYQVNTNMASFKKNVVGKNPDYTLKSDTLQYNTKTNIVYFRAPTVLTDVDGNIFNYEEGEYDTNQGRSNLAKGEIETTSYILTGDKLSLDDIHKRYTATGHVEMISKEQDVIITGDHSYYQKDKGIAKVYGHALMRKIMTNDTLYLSADTLMSIDDPDPTKERLLAYHNVRIFKTDLQGVADSLAYVTADSIIYFFNNPVLWSGGNQMTADSINVRIANGTIDKLNMNVNSFVISNDSIDNYNQIKGRTMIAHFDNGNIKKVDVNGNGESLFFALNDEETQLVGMNKIVCSDMVINFKLNVADNISFYVNPDASFIPPHELKTPDRTLPGFSWQEDKKPSKREMKVLKDATSAPPQQEDVVEEPSKPIDPKRERIRKNISPKRPVTKSKRKS